MPSLIEIGGVASGLIAIITLITKLIHLISEIQKLIYRLDLIQKEMDQTKSQSQLNQEELDKQDKRILKLEMTFQTISDYVQEIKNNLKELSLNVAK